MDCFRLFHKQVEFAKSTEREVLFYGGAGAGKSYAQIVNLYMRASNEGAIEGWFCSENADVRYKFLEVWKSLVPKERYTINKSEQSIRIEGGGTIYYSGLRSLRWQGRQLTGAHFEDLQDVENNDYLKVDTLTRLKVEGLSPQLFSVCNPPRDEKHWILDYFNPMKSGGKRRVVCTNVRDGYLKDNAEYVAQLQAHGMAG